MKRLIVIAIACLAASMFPYSLARVQRLGYDFPIYWNAGRGDISHDYGRGAFVYNDKVALAFRPIAQFSLPVAFGLFYAATVAAYAGLVVLLLGARGDRVFLGIAALLVSGLAIFVVLRCGNITGILALACVTPLGSVLAGCCKPYLFAFTVVHAAIFCHRHSKAAPVQVHRGQGEPRVRRNHLRIVE